MLVRSYMLLLTTFLHGALTAASGEAVVSLTDSGGCFSDDCSLNCAESYNVDWDYDSGWLTLSSNYEGTQCECATATATFDSTDEASGHFGEPIDQDFYAIGSYGAITVTIDQCDATYTVNSGCLLTVGTCVPSTTTPLAESCLFGPDVGMLYLVWLLGPVVLCGIILGVGKACATCKMACADSVAAKYDPETMVWQCSKNAPCCLMRCLTCRVICAAFQTVITLILFINGCIIAAALSHPDEYGYVFPYAMDIVAPLSMLLATWDALLNASQMFDALHPYFIRRRIASFVLDCTVVISAAFYGIAGTRGYESLYYQHFNFSSCAGNVVLWSLLCFACSIALLVIQGCYCCKYCVDYRAAAKVPLIEPNMV